MKMNKFRSELRRFKENYENYHSDYSPTIAGLIGWLEGGKVITKEEANYLMSLYSKRK